MLINVGYFIWQNQNKVLGLKPVDEETMGKACHVAYLVSCVNMMFSIPKLFFLANGLSHRAIIDL